MIAMDRLRRQVQLNKCIFQMETYYIYWKQFIRLDGTLVEMGFFYRIKRHTDWNKTLKGRIIKMFLGEQKEVVTQSTNRT